MSDFDGVYGNKEIDYAKACIDYGEWETDVKWDFRSEAEYVNFDTFSGKVLKNITVNGDIIIFVCEDDTMYFMYHSQSCCENVYLADVVGDFKYLIGNPILLAEEVINEKDETDKGGDFIEFTFYKLATIKGYVDLRWIGTSNGYYSTSVSLKRLNADIARKLLLPV